VGMFGRLQYALSDGAGVVKVDPCVAPIPTAWLESEVAARRLSQPSPKE
jgi:hypothetical protein